jgi:hypothetical protein
VHQFSFGQKFGCAIGSSDFMPRRQLRGRSPFTASGKAMMCSPTVSNPHAGGDAGREGPELLATACRTGLLQARPDPKQQVSAGLRLSDPERIGNQFGRKALEAIYKWLANWNGSPAPFIWKALADVILDKVRRCKELTKTGD